MDYSSHSSNAGVFFATSFIRLKTMYARAIGYVLVINVCVIEDGCWNYECACHSNEIVMKDESWVCGCKKGCVDGRKVKHVRIVGFGRRKKCV